MALVEHLSNETVIEELEALAAREKAFLESDKCDPVAREVFLYNITILAAASARVKMLNSIIKSENDI